MEIIEYLHKLFKLDVLKYNTILTLLAIPTESVDTNGAINRIDGKFIANLNGETITINHNFNEFEPLLTPKQPITLKANTFANQPDEVATTVGRCIVNSVLLVYPFKDKIPFINSKASIRDIESLFTPRLTKDITIDEHLKFKQSCDVIGQLTRLIVHSATPKNMVAPPGIAKFKKALLKRYEDEGKSLQNPIVATEFKNELAKYDDEYLKGDPSHGVFISGKVKDVSRSKVHLAYGQVLAMGGEKATVLSRSLSEGVVVDKESMVTANNSLRAGSVSRGKDIVTGGVTATLMTRIVAHLSVANKDCGTTKTINVLVRDGEANRYVGRYIISNGKTTRVETSDIPKITNKVIRVRSILRCDDQVMCRVCAGDKMSSRPNSIGLFAFELSSKVVKASLAKFHGVKLEVAKISLDDFN